MRLLFLSLLLSSSLRAEAPGERAARQLVDEFRALSPDFAFYLAGKLTGVAVLERDFEKGKRIWLIYAQEFRHHPYVVPAGIQAALIARIGAGGSEESDQILQRVIQSTGKGLLHESCQETARRWIVRSQLGRLAASLRQFYSRHIGYPDSLDKLVATGLAAPGDLRTPWGAPFEYRLVANDIFPGQKDQAYHLSAPQFTEADRKPEELLDEWFSMLPRYVLWGVGESNDGRPTALVGKSDKGSAVGNKTSVLLGEKIDGLTLVQADRVGAILARADYILVLPQRIMQTGAP